MEDIFDFVDELGKWGRGEGKDEGEKSHPSHKLPFSIEWDLIL